MRGVLLASPDLVTGSQYSPIVSLSSLGCMASGHIVRVVAGNCEMGMR